VPFILIKKCMKKCPHFYVIKCGHKTQRFLNVGSANGTVRDEQASL